MKRVIIPPYELPPEYEKAASAWARPERREQGDRAEQVIFTAVGKTLSRWELVENFMARLFALIVETPSPAAARAFGTVGSAVGRHAMIKHASEAYFDTPVWRHAGQEISVFRRKHDIRVLDRLLANYKEAASRRNDIAHGIVTRIVWGADGDFGFFLVPPDYNSHRTSLPPDRRGLNLPFGIDGRFQLTRNKTYLRRASYAYASADISEFAKKFEQLSLIVAHFIHNLRAIEEHGDQQ